MAWSVGSVLILVGVLVVLGIVVGWVVVSRRSRTVSQDPTPAAPASVDEPAAEVVDEQEPAAEPAAAQPAAAEVAVEAEPVGATEPEPTTPEPTTPEPITPEPITPAPDATSAPVAPVAADPGPADDFRRIEGIGPKMAATLQAAGIRTYQQLADTDEATLRAAVRAAGGRASASLPSWPQRARKLAGGDG